MANEAQEVQAALAGYLTTLLGIKLLDAQQTGSGYPLPMGDDHINLQPDDVWYQLIVGNVAEHHFLGSADQTVSATALVDFWYKQTDTVGATFDGSWIGGFYFGTGKLYATIDQLIDPWPWIVAGSVATPTTVIGFDVNPHYSVSPERVGDIFHAQIGFTIQIRKT